MGRAHDGMFSTGIGLYHAEFERQCYVGSAFLIISAWVRYAGTLKDISTNTSLALLMLGQMLSGIAQPMFQVIGPFYSETWFDLKGRTTTTMITAVANPFGSGLSQIISPIPDTARNSILVLAIVCTAVAPFALLTLDAPPTPPSETQSLLRIRARTLTLSKLIRQPRRNPLLCLSCGLFVDANRQQGALTCLYANVWTLLLAHSFSVSLLECRCLPSLHF